MSKELNIEKLLDLSAQLNNISGVLLMMTRMLNSAARDLSVACGKEIDEKISKQEVKQ